jgi:catechol 2,3-dioxygenase-like lactoylglutathione lyase family enzyme
MESVIAKLLSDFENGRMTRRQLIQSLSMAALAAPMASLSAQGGPSAAVAGSRAGAAAPWKTVWLDHISFQVSDYKRSVDFYTNLMGWTVKNDNGTSQATLDINGIGGIIVRNGRNRGAAGQPGANPAPATPAAASRPDSAGGTPPGQPPRAPITGVIDHISWGVEPWDTDGVKAELERRGLNPRPDMVGADFKSYHVKDPDGWDLQISNQTKEKHT